MSSNPINALRAGILGGLGPQATVDFMAKIVATTPASTDQDHLPLLIDHNPTVPNRHQAIAGETPSVSPDLAAMARRLEKAGADFLVMVCNTAHAYSDDIRQAVSIPFVSMIDIVADELVTRGFKSAGIMAAEGCLHAGLYQEALKDRGIEPVLWSDSELHSFMALVYRIKAGETDADITSGLEKLAASLAFSGAECLVAGCTEVPLFLNQHNSPLPLLSSTDLLVARTIALATHQHTLET